MKRRWLATIVLAVLVSSGATAQRPSIDRNKILYGSDDNQRVLVLGCVTKDPKYNYGRMQGIAEYVLERVTDLGYGGVEVFTVDSSEKMGRLLRAGRVDWLSATPYDAVTYVDHASGELLLTKSQRGRAWYRSVFFARNDSGIASLADLRGKIIAFEKPTSTSAYVLPAAILRRSGLDLVQLASIDARPPPDAVGYLFSGDESNTSIWVHKKMVDAGAYSDGDWQSDWINPPAFREDMSIFHHSEDVPRSVEIVRTGLPDELKSRLREILLGAPADPDALPALKNYYNATGFAEVTDDVRAALDAIRGGIAQLDAAD